MNHLIFLLIFSAFTFAGPHSTVEPLGKWPTNEVNVCWLNDVPLNTYNFTESQMPLINPLKPSLAIFSSQTKKIIQDQIAQEFNLARTGISFVGWKDCSKTNDPDVILLTGSGFNFEGYIPTGRSSIGYDSEHEVEFLYLNEEPYSQKVKLSNDDYLRNLAIHEFGHLLGLMHEHARLQAHQDPKCRYKEYEETHSSRTTYYSGYDPESVMNYCHNNTVTETGLNNELMLGLSRLDIHGLKCLYQYTPAQVQKLCNPDFI